MALTTFEDYLKSKGLTLDIIANLADEPNDADGLGADQLKAKFDEAGKIIATYINKTLIPEIASDIDAASQGIASGGGIDGSRLNNGSIPDAKIINLDGAKINDGTLTAAKHVKGSITRELLSEDAKTLQTEDFPNKVVPQRALADQCVSNAKIENGAVNEDKVNPGSRTQHHILTASTNWSGSASPYTQTINADGMLSTDRPKVFFHAPDNFADVEAQQEAFGLLYSCDSANGSITLYAKEKPAVAFSILCEVNRI